MQWDATPNAGFTGAGVETWLPLADDFASVNVEAQQNDPHSDLNYFRALTHLRQTHPALVGGTYESLDSGHDDVFLFRRTLGPDTLLVALNFGAETHPLTLLPGQTLLSSLNDQPPADAPLRANEARIVLNS